MAVDKSCPPTELRPHRMIIKKRDAAPHTMDRLERRTVHPGERALRKVGLGSAARSRDETPTRQACAFIDARFGASPQWAVVHDLRVIVDGRASRFDHLLIDDLLDIVLVDTRFIDSGLYLFERGRCETFDGVERRLVASPLERMSRDMRTLSQVARNIEVPRGRSRHRPQLALRGYVLIDPALRLGASIDDAREGVGVCSRDALLPVLRKRRLRQPRTVSGRLSSAALARFASALVEHHRPILPDEPIAVTDV